MIKVDKIIPGNAMRPAGTDRPGQRSSSDRQQRRTMPQQFVADLKSDLKVKRNDSAIQAFRTRLLTSGG